VGYRGKAEGQPSLKPFDWQAGKAENKGFEGF